MKIIWAICRFELKRLFDDRKQLFLVIALPLVFAYVFGNVSSQGTVKIPVAFVDEDQTDSSKEMMKRIAANDLLDLQEMSQEQAEKQVKDQKAAGYIVVPKGLEKQLLAGEKAVVRFKTDSNRVTGAAFDQAIRDALASLSIDAKAAGVLVEHNKGLQQTQAYTEILKEPIQKTDIHTITVSKLSESQKLSSMNRSSIGFTMMFIMYSMMSATGVFLYAKQQGIWYRTMSMPVTRRQIILGYLLSFFVMGWVQMGIIMAITSYWFDVQWGDPLSVFALVSALLLSVIGLGLFLAGYVKTLQQQSALSTVFVLSSCMLGGAFWPIEIVPDFMKTIAHFVPQYWALDGFTEIVARGGGIADILQPILILLGVAVVFLALGVRRIRFNV
jgi:ABC-2 type transport system permease protein